MMIPIEKILWAEKGTGLAACGKIPERGDFFQDHFPDFPVLPGVLALDLLKGLADRHWQLSGESSSPVLKSMHHVRFLSFLAPGEEWEAVVRIAGRADENVEWSGQLTAQGKTAVSARWNVRLIP